MFYCDEKKNVTCRKNSLFLSPPFRLQPHNRRRRKTRAHGGARRLKCILLALHYSGEDFTLIPPSLPRPFYLSPPSEPPVLGEMKAPTTQRFHLLSAGPPASKEEWGRGWGGKAKHGEQLQ